MNLNDGYAPVLGKEFSGSGNQPPFSADMSNLQSRLIFKANPPAGAGAKQSARMDFSRPDAVNVRVLNLILWHDRKGRKPLPASKHTVIPADSRQDDD
jgi:hypothetical protein